MAGGGSNVLIQGGAITISTGADKRQAPLRLDPATDELISQAANFLSMSKNDFVAAAARVYLDQCREEIRQRMVESIKRLDGSLIAEISLLTGVSPERIEDLGGVDGGDK